MFTKRALLGIFHAGRHSNLSRDNDALKRVPNTRIFTAVAAGVLGLLVSLSYLDNSVITGNTITMPSHAEKGRHSVYIEHSD